MGELGSACKVSEPKMLLRFTMRPASLFLINGSKVFVSFTTLKKLVANTTATTDDAVLTQTFATNFFNVVKLTNTLLPLIKKSDAGRIVNLSSILGSLTLHADPNSPIYASKLFSYNASKTALNAYTVHLAAALADTNIKVNSGHPGWVKTDLGSDAAPMLVDEGAKTSVELALLGSDGPTGKFFHLGQELPW